MNGASSDSNYAAARRQILPPVVFLIALIAMAVLHWVVPLATVVSAPYNLAGIPLIAAGLLGAMLASNRFRRIGTPVRPFEQSVEDLGAYFVISPPLVSPSARIFSDWLETEMVSFISSASLS